VEELIVIRILLIDDDVALLDIAKIFLQKEKGLAIDTSLSAEEALDKLKRNRFDVIVSDYLMPGMNGIELLKKLKSEGNPTPFILFTGRGREDVAIDALNNGASFYLQKGGDPKSQFAELVNIIKTSARQAQAENMLRQEKDRAQQYIDLAGVMLLALDKDGKVTLVNGKGCEILGYEEDQILGKSWFDNFLKENRRDEVKAVFNGLMRGELEQPKHQFTNSVLCRGGVERRIAFTNALVKNEKGEIVGTLSSGMDITEREKAEDALKVNIAKYKALFESLPLGMTISDKEGNIVESNREAERLLGLSREEQVKRQIDGREWRIVRPDGSPMPASEYASVRAMKEDRRVADVEMGLVKGDGSVTWINVTATPIPLAGNGVAIAYTDITERKLAADALRESEERYRKLVEGMLEGVAYCQMLYDDRGHPVDWIYLNVNSNFEKLTGLRDVVGKRVTEAIPGIEKSNPELFEIYARVASSGKPEVFESEIKLLRTWLRVSVFCPEKDHFVAIFENITKRKQTEGALKDSEMKYRQLVELAQEGIWAIDADANTTYVNPRMAEMLGCTPEEMMERHLFSFMDERGKEIARIGLDRREQGIKEQHDFEFLRKDGQRIYTSLETSPTIDEAGNYTGALAIVADITERKRIEDALRESEKRYRLLVESAAEAIIVAQDGMLRLVNPMTVAMIGLSEQELMSKPFPAFIHPDDRAMVVDSYQRRLRGEAVPARYAFRLLAKDGITKWVEISAVAIDWEGRPATLNFLTDITERKLAEEMLRKSESSYRQLADGITDMFLALDKSLRCTYWNKTCEELTGISASDAIGKPISELTPGPQGERAKEVYLDVLRTGKARIFSSEIAIGGKNHAVESTIYPFENGLSIITKDITERKRAEEALKKSEAKFAIAFNSSPEMMMIGSLKDGRVLEVNDSFIRITGHSRETVLGRTIAELGVIGEAERIRIQSAMEKKGSVEGLEIHAHAKSGDDRNALFTGAVISLEGEPCILAIISDVTDKKRAEEALRASEARFLSFMSHIPAVAYMSDASDRYLYINKAYEVAFDVKESDVVGKTVEEMWPAATAAAYRKSDQQVLASNEGIELIEIIPHKNGPREYLTFKFPVSDARGTSKVLGGVSIDITEQRRVEKALRQANKKLNLLGSVTRHDVINQLSVLFAWLEIAKEVARDESVHEHLARVGEAAKIIQRQLEFTADYCCDT